jgi:hypothetical protein
MLAARGCYNAEVSDYAGHTEHVHWRVESAAEMHDHPVLKLPGSSVTSCGELASSC